MALSIMEAYFSLASFTYACHYASNSSIVISVPWHIKKLLVILYPTAIMVIFLLLISSCPAGPLYWLSLRLVDTPTTRISGRLISNLNALVTTMTHLSTLFLTFWALFLITALPKSEKYRSNPIYSLAFGLYEYCFYKWLF